MAVQVEGVIVGGFKKCCISTVVEGTDGDMLWNVRRGARKMKTDCEDGDSDTDW